MIICTYQKKGPLSSQEELRSLELLSGPVRYASYVLTSCKCGREMDMILSTALTTAFILRETYLAESAFLMWLCLFGSSVLNSITYIHYKNKR
jgi:hypothetical protein